MGWIKRLFEENKTKYTAAVGNNQEEGIEEDKLAATTAQAAAEAATTKVVGNEKTSSYTLVLSDAGKCVEYNSSSNGYIEIPQHSSVAWPVGTIIEMTQFGTGVMEIKAGSGVEIKTPTGTNTAREQWSTVGVRCYVENKWILSGDLT